MITRIRKRLETLTGLARQCRHVDGLSGLRLVRQVFRGDRLCQRHRFEPDELLHFGLLRPDCPDGEADRFISQKRLTRVQKAVNPMAWRFQVNNKACFHRHAVALGLPTPPVLATVFPDGAAASGAGESFIPPADWPAFLDHHLPSDFVVKQIVGRHGDGLNAFTRRNGHFVNLSGGEHDTPDFCLWLREHARVSGSLIQQRIYPHAELVRLSDTDFLQTMRILTLVDAAGQPRVLHAYLKVITGQTVVDAFHDGATGNFEAAMDLSTGRLAPAAMFARNGQPPYYVPAHPRTGIAFDSFQVPRWRDALDLACRAAVRLLPLHALGWDMAVTPGGPIIIEANPGFYGPNEHGCMHSVYNAMTKVADQLHHGSWRR